MNPAFLRNSPAVAMLRYGHNSTCELPDDDLQRLAPHNAQPLADVAEAVRTAWTAPLEFPSLSQATVPGDTAAVAISRCAPQPEELALGAVAALMDAGVEPCDIAIVTSAALDESLARRLAELEAPGVRQVVHDPNDIEMCAMVGVMQDDSPLRLNRWIAEADLVLPVGIAETAADEINAAEQDRHASKFAAIYPEFADSEGRQAFQKQANKLAGRLPAKLAAVQDEAGWLLGVLSTLQVVASRGEGIAAVFAGEASRVAQASHERAQESWCVAAEKIADSSADLVVAAVCGEPRRQTWEHVSRALSVAERLVEPGGAILLCTDLASQPRGAFRKLRNADDLADVERQLKKDETEHASSALRIAQSLARGPVYLRSQLRPAEVESLGMTPVADDEEIARLVSRYERCVLVEDAQRLAPSR